MCIFVYIFYINNTAKGNTSLMLNKLQLLTSVVPDRFLCNLLECRHIRIQQFVVCTGLKKFLQNALQFSLQN